MAIRQEYMRRVFGKETDHAKELERLECFARVALKFLDAKLVGTNIGSASVERPQLMAQLKERQISRTDLIAATTMHPVWGPQVRDILRFVIEHAAMRPRIPNPTPPPKFISNPNYISDLSYESLAGQRGRLLLDQQISLHFAGYHPRAREFAGLMFTSFDMLTISLSERQKQTQTRGHNADVEDKDRILMIDPLAAAVHRLERYGGNDADWTAWWLLYLQPIPEDGTYGAQSDTTDGARDLRQLQRLAVAHQEMFFDTSTFAGQIPLSGFCQSFFPDTYNMVTLGRGERLWVGDYLYDNNGNMLLRMQGTQIIDSIGNHVADLVGDHIHSVAGADLGPKSEARVTDSSGRVIKYADTGTTMELYETAEVGWLKMLEMAFQSLPQNLTKDQIMEEVKEGGKGGLLGMWLQAAGQAKMFPGDHLRLALAPMLTHFIFRLFAQYVSNRWQERRELFNEVIEALEKTRISGGLSSTDLAPLVQQVIDNLRGDQAYHGMSSSLQPGRNNRDVQLENYLRMYWRIKKRREAPAPARRLVPDELKSADEKAFWAMRGRVIPPEPSIRRQGSLLQPKEKG